MNAADYLERQLVLFTECECTRGGDNHDSLCGRTYPEHSVAIRDWILEPCLRKSDRPRFQCLQMTSGQRTEWHNYLDVKSHGGYSMLNGGYLKGVKESFLSQILVPASLVQKKYYLSKKACEGIMRRANARGKKLPEALRMALEHQSSCGCGGGCDGGGKGALLSENKSLTLAANANDQVVFSFDSLPSNCMKSSNPNSGCRQVEIAKTLDTTTQDPSKNQGGIAVAFCIAGNTIDRQVQNGGNGAGFQEKIRYTLNTMDRHAVAYESMSITGGQNAYAIGNGQRNQSTMTDKAGALNCMHDQIAVMQKLVTENKQLEVCAPMTDEDSTDKM